MSKQLSKMLLAGALAVTSVGVAYAVDSQVAVMSQQQKVTVTGTVYDSTGEPVIGASVQAVGSAAGVQTNLDGKFSLSGVKAGTEVKVTYVGCEPYVFAAGAQPVSITLKDASHVLDEVVVTALGMKRETKALGYAVTEVKGDEIKAANTISPVAALQGKVAGVDIAASDGGIFGATKIQIRGNSTLGSNNQPIYVVDGVILDNATSGNTDLNWTANPSDYGNELKNLNPDDFESVSVLKGAAATALYGSRALNGAVVITTKSGKGGKKGVGVSFSQTFGFDVIVDNPGIQYEYGYGMFPGQNTALANRWASAGTPNNPNEFGQSTIGSSLKSANWQSYGWGAKYDGSPIENYDGTMTTYSPYENGMNEYYQTGFNTNTNIAISGGNDKASFYSSLSYKHVDGQTPNNVFDRYSMLLKGSYKITDKLDVNASVSTSYSKPQNAQQEVGLYFVYSGIPAHINPGYWSDKYKGAHGGLASTSYGDEYGYVPSTVKSLWWNLNENSIVQKEWVFRPTFEVNYKILDWLRAKVDGNINYYTRELENKQLGSGYANEGGYYGLSSYSKTQLTLGATVSADKRFGDFNVGGFARFEYYNKTEQSLSVETKDGLIVPGQYFIGNSKGTPNYSGKISGTKRMLSAIFAANFSWKDQVYVDVTGRNDWSSALVYTDGHGNYSYFYPSVSGSWLISETFRDQLPEWITFAKVRGSWAQVGNDLDPYKLTLGYNVGTIKLADGNIYTNYYKDNTIYDLNLKPERKNSWEVGLDFRVLDNRIGLDFTYYKENTTDQIMEISVPGVSGVNKKMVNAGNIQNAGVEIALNTVPIKTKDWTWEVDLTYTKNNSKIVSLHPDVADFIALQGQVNAYDYRIGSVAQVGGAYGQLMTDIMPARDENGNVLLYWDDYWRDAYPKRSGKLEVIGDVNPDFLGSITSTLRYKDWGLKIALDGRFGGMIASYANHYGTMLGWTESSLKGRDAAHGGITWTSQWGESAGMTYHDGVIPEGVFVDGTTITCVDGVTRDMSGVSFADAVANGWLEPIHAGAHTYDVNDWSYGVINDDWVEELNYIALREITLSYNMPKTWASKIGAQNITLSATGRNLCYLYNSLTNNLNPESVRGNASGEFRIRSFNPYTANFMFTVNVNF